MKSGEGPAVLAKHLQQWLKLVDVREPSRARFYAALSEASRRAIVDAAPLAWLPIEIDVEMAEVLAQVLGPVGAHAFYAAMFRATASSSILSPMIRTAWRLFGVGPASFARWIPKGWAALFRDVGTITATVDEGARRATLVHTGIPRVCAQSEPWVTSLASCVEPILDYARKDGVVRTDRSRLGEGTVVVAIEWR